jgi:hypothetical protein
MPLNIKPYYDANDWFWSEYRGRQIFLFGPELLTALAPIIVDSHTINCESIDLDYICLSRF